MNFADMRWIRYLLPVFLAVIGAIPPEAPAQIDLPGLSRHEQRSLDLQAINKLKQANEKGEEKCQFAEEIAGPHRFRVTVTDKETHKGIPGSQVDSALFPSLPAGTTLSAYSYIVARPYAYLESKTLDAAGSAEWENLPAAVYVFQASAEDYLTQSIQVTIPDDGEDAAIALQRGASISGRLIDAKTGKPMPDIAISLYSRIEEGRAARMMQEHANTDADGRFSVKGLDRSLWQLSLERNIVMMTQWQSAKFQGIENPQAFINPFPASVDLSDGKPHDLGDIVVHRVPMAEVQITDERGNPLPGMGFELVLQEDSTSSYDNQIKTDAEGRATVPLLGYRRPQKAAICIPDQGKESYRIPWNGANVADPLAGFDEAAYRAHLKKYPSEIAMFGPAAWQKPPKTEVEWQAAIDKAIELHKRELIAQANLPIHPNVAIFEPKPDETSQVHLTYKPASDAIHLSFRVVDRVTKQPVREFKGIVTAEAVLARMFMVEEFLPPRPQSGLETQAVRFASKDQTGRVELPTIPLPQQIRQIEAFRKQGARMGLEQGSVPAGYGPQEKFYVSVSAKGYATKGFSFPLGDLRKGNEIVLDLMPEAIVTGRLVMAGTNAPVTSNTLATLTAKTASAPPGPPRPDQLYSRGELPYKILVLLTNEGLQFSSGNAETPDSLGMAAGTVDGEGRFRIAALRPAPGWNLVVTAPPLPQLARTNLDLKPGINDLGDLTLGRRGTIRGFVLDTNNQPLAGAFLKFPLEISAAPLGRVRTKDDGGYEVETTEFIQDTQLVRLFPPWGVGKNAFGTIDLNESNSIFFDCIKTLNRFEETQFSPILPKGHTLTLTIPVTPDLRRIADFYLAPENIEGGPRGLQFEQRYFGIRGIGLLGLKATEQGFVYNQYRIADGGLKVSTQTLTMTFRNVPPGRYAELVEGGVYYPQKDDTPYPADMTPFPVDTTPYSLSYAEVEMPDHDATVQLAVKGSEITVALTNRPVGYPLQRGPEVLLTLDRLEPRSTGFGGGLARILAGISSNRGNLDAQRLPLLSYTSGFSTIRPDANTGRFPYRPALFPLVPPGRYRLSARIGKGTDLLLDPKAVFFNKEITVKHGQPTLKLEVPYPTSSPAR